MTRIQSQLNSSLEVATKKFKEEVDHIKQEVMSANNNPNNLTTSIHIDKFKMEHDLKCNKSQRELEERINSKLSDIENRHNNAISQLKMQIENSFNLQNDLITKMNEEQRWMEEEAIRMRVEHEARIKQEMLQLEDRMRKERDEAVQRAIRIESQFRSLAQNLQKAVDQHSLETNTFSTPPTNQRRDIRLNESELGLNMSGHDLIQALLQRSNHQ
ncbi:hypothetical protein AKO1_005050, partial [Acrasis kona]